MIFLSILVFIFIIGLIILIHEAGHFYFAKKAGILCHEFSIGMGPILYSVKKGETAFSIRAIPIGGFVSMAGEEVSSSLIQDGQMVKLNLENGCVSEIILNEFIDGDICGTVAGSDLYGETGENLYIKLVIEGQVVSYPVLKDAFYVLSDKKRMQITPYDRCFEAKPLFSRFLTIFFGPFMNFILAIFIYLIYWCALGVPNYSSSVIGEVSHDYPASEIVIAGDEVVKINGYTVNGWSTKEDDSLSGIMDRLAIDGVTTINLTVKRDGQIMELAPIHNNIVINSVGISNLGVTIPENIPENVNSSIYIGRTAMNYVSTPDSSEIILDNGDIITGICVQHATKVGGKVVYDNNSTYEKVSTWSDIVGILYKADVCRVYFEFYDSQTNEIVKTKTAIEAYGNELLDNQRIEKIVINIGITPVTHFSFTGVISHTFESFWSDFTLIFRTLKLLIAPSGIRQVGAESLSGVVGIFSMVQQYMSAGFLAVLGFMALLSVNIGVMNLLPIPALDGGRLVFLLYEAITRRKPNKKVENTLNNIMFIILMIFFVYVTFNDITRLFK